MDILVLGGAGQVGTELQAHPWPEGVRVHAPTRDALDITDPAAVAAALAERAYAAVINTAAYTAVDKAEADVTAAWRLNALAPALLAEQTRARGIPLVHVSTDYVFAGTKPEGAYAPDEPVDPRSVYGASKAAGEFAVRTGNPRHAILRTAWVVSPHRGNFVKTMLRLAGERDALTVVDDQHGCPTSAADLAAALATVALRMARDPDAPTGTFHCVNAGSTTWRGFAEAIVAGGARRGGRTVPVTGIPTSAYPTPARRPANSRLSTDSLTAAYGVVPRPWQAALADILDRLVGPVHTGTHGDPR
ncbi:dTDP-4-dehydrorhamnose reductase [Methylobacterium sp. J-076]|uniref:dTDP-4-dehydrorhamnose reductase n=1 Tax=Methylobacterium sp. J-076 TaxID=2836655 RepID=UPI001FB95F60|nr:dTDP-4-dehydrorhamnose reductase [Methylobacterium sp. J-076]MCJ2012878.1 dTDP-4-dehydrorhamnose reductase [Methylobacterium sp. J-076]